MFSTLRRRDLLYIYLIPLVSNTTGSMTGAIGVLYALDLKATIFQVNLIPAIASAMGGLFLVPFGTLSDKIGRKRVLLVIQTMIILGTTIKAFATSPMHLILASLAGGFATGGSFPTLLSIIGDVTTSRDRNEAISTLYLFSSIGLFVGPTIESVLLTLPSFKLRNAYQLDSICQTCVLIFTIFVIKETKEKTERTSYKGNISETLRNKTVIATLVMTAMFFFFNAIEYTYVPIYSRETLGLTDSEIASLSIFRWLSTLLIRLLMISILKTISTKHLLTTVLAIAGVVGIVTPFTYNYMHLVMIMLLHGIIFGVYIILSAQIIAEATTPSNRGLANSIYVLTFSVGIMAQMFTPPIAESQGLKPVFIIGGLLPLMAITLALTIKTQNKSNLIDDKDLCKSLNLTNERCMHAYLKVMHAKMKKRW